MAIFHPPPPPPKLSLLSLFHPYYVSCGEKREQTIFNLKLEGTGMQEDCDIALEMLLHHYNFLWCEVHQLYVLHFSSSSSFLFFLLPFYSSPKLHLLVSDVVTVSTSGQLLGTRIRKRCKVVKSMKLLVRHPSLSVSVNKQSDRLLPFHSPSPHS